MANLEPFLIVADKLRLSQTKYSTFISPRVQEINWKSWKLEFHVNWRKKFPLKRGILDSLQF